MYQAIYTCACCGPVKGHNTGTTSCTCRGLHTTLSTAVDLCIKINSSEAIGVLDLSPEFQIRVQYNISVISLLHIMCVYALRYRV